MVLFQSRPLSVPPPVRVMKRCLQVLRQSTQDEHLHSVLLISTRTAEDLARQNPGKLDGSFDNGDPQTTNLHVANLPANVTANAIGMHFAQFGPVASVKIMWPKEEGGVNVSLQANSANIAARKAGLNGFISFMKRRDAEKALDKCDNSEWGGSILRMGWGKAMPLPPRPAYGRRESSDCAHYVKPRC